MPALIFILIFFLIEISLFIIIGSKIGLLATFLFIFLSGFIGIRLLKRTSFNFIKYIQTTLQEKGQIDHEIFSKFCACFAAILFIIPGFFTSLIGILLYIPELQNWLLKKESFLKKYVGSLRTKEASDKKIIEADYIELDDEKNEEK